MLPSVAKMFKKGSLLAEGLYTDFWNREVKLAALIHGAFHPDFAAVDFDNLAGQRKAESSSTEAASHAAVDLIATVEDFVELIFRDTDAEILHAHIQHRAFVLNPDFDAIRLALCFRA